MKSFIYVTLLLIALSFCDDCSSKIENECTGTCEWTAGTAATCVKKTDCAHTGTGDTFACTDTINCEPNDGSTACESIAASCALNAAGDACASAAGCVFTAATQGKCAESSSDSAFGLKTSFLLIFLYFFF